jgi:enamine deaminase RidA (YjgF/YER057c/UK114 family)
MNIERWPARGAGRSRASALEEVVWLVANATDPAADFRGQVTQTLAALDDTLRAAGSSRARLLSVQVLLSDVGNKAVFDEMWLDWIGTDPDGWPQRSCVQVGLTAGLLVEIVVVAARDCGHQRH